MRKRKQSELKKRKIIKNKIRQANNKLKKQKKDNSSPSSNRFEKSNAITWQNPPLYALRGIEWYLRFFLTVLFTVCNVIIQGHSGLVH